MSVYKFFPSKTATLYSYTPLKNAGLDEIADLSLYESIEGTSEVSRILLKFDSTEINDFLSRYNITSSSDYKAYLKLYLAKASEIPLEYTIYSNAISGNWDMGTGRLANYPETQDGVSWTNRTTTNIWTTSSFSTYYSGSFITGSSTGSFSSGNEGGGTWWTNFKWSDFASSSLQTSQSFVYNDSKDIELDLSTIFEYWSFRGLPNDGVIIRHNSNLEFNTSSYFETKYFTGNTHTIYPPCLEVKWNTYSYNTGSLSVVTTSDIVSSISNNKGEYQQDSVQRFRLNIRDKNPVRSFQTSSVYLNNKILPTSSYWAIKDYNTEEMIIDYDITYTKLNANSNGNYFDVYMNGLEPERYYRILIKSIINGETIILDNNNIFKVIR